MNLIGPELVRDLVTLLYEPETSQDIRIMVLESADPDYFVPYVDLTKVADYPWYCVPFGAAVFANNYVALPAAADQENPTLAAARQRTSAMRWPAVMRAAAALAWRWRDPGACLARSAAATPAGPGDVIAGVQAC